MILCISKGKSGGAPSTPFAQFVPFEQASKKACSAIKWSPFAKSFGAADYLKLLDSKSRFQTPETEKSNSDFEQSFPSAHPADSDDSALQWNKGILAKQANGYKCLNLQEGSLND